MFFADVRFGIGIFEHRILRGMLGIWVDVGDMGGCWGYGWLLGIWVDVGDMGGCWGYGWMLGIWGDVFRGTAEGVMTHVLTLYIVS